MDSKKYKKQYRRTFNGLISTIYDQQKSSSKKRGHNPPLYSKNELFQWILMQENFEFLFEQWKISEYLPKLRPSVDRLDDNLGYSFNNIRLTTWKENNLKAGLHSKNGTRLARHSPVVQFKDNIKIQEFISINEASRTTGINYSGISSCCVGRHKTAGGFIWRYTNDV